MRRRDADKLTIGHRQLGGLECTPAPDGRFVAFGMLIVGGLIWLMPDWLWRRIERFLPEDTEVE